ncbi:MAG: glycosyltransferase family 2 protein [Plectolyngbya sp. WJT66-NPBG17]|jgi:glycosyltransferase involved in cell wall biosynthesis|nr:glycosyltransferase family 2 protein [Plectolyngbya sp. WJT66-NPBG17]
MTTCSLLVPCHNAAAYLPRLWATVQAQSVPFDEIICYDDGSTDNTAEVAQQLGATVIRGDVCRGAAFARNQLAQAATCDWIHFHDADDTLHPEYLAQTKAKIQPEIDVIVCDADWIDEATQQLLIPRRYTQQELDKNALAATLTNPIGVISGLYRKELFLSIDGFNESFQCWEDSDLHIRLAAAGAKFSVVEAVLSYSLRHDRGLSRNQQICSNCRLQLLQIYATQFESLRSLIALEAERVAIAALLQRDLQMAQRAVQFCISIGQRPPTTHNPILKALKVFLPALQALYLQQWMRNPKLFLDDSRT